LKEHGFLLGIVTDTVLPISKKLRWFTQGGFGHVWDAIISSCDIGIRKPNPGIYQAALQQLGVTVEEAVFVGHAASEIQGAENVGLTTIAFNYEDGANADIYIEHFADLLTLPILS
jgi:putative hydrolase of the HAD superfamily